MKIICVSDTHNKHNDVEMPYFDDEVTILIHAGDSTGRGRENEIKDFFIWLKEQSKRYTYVVFIAGNHDFCFEKRGPWMDNLLNDLTENTNIYYLQDETIELEGLKIYGTPYQPFFHNWAFNLHRGKPLEEKWSLIPDDTDILICHGGPAYVGNLNYVMSRYGGDDVGCLDLYNRIKQLTNLKLFVQGHIHQGYNYYEEDRKLFINACVCDESYNPTNKPFVVDTNNWGVIT